jgi:hypothetical protein
MGTTPITSGLNPDMMQVLATTSTQQLLWDFSETENFYVLTLSTKTLQKTSPSLAYNFYVNSGVTTIYNPFIFNAYLGSISNLV